MKPRPFHHQRPLAVCAAAYGAGVAAGVFFVWRPVLYALGLALSIGMVFLLSNTGRRRVLGCMAASLFLGALLGGMASHPSLPETGKYSVTGTLSADAVLRDDGTAAGYLERVVLEREGESVSLPKVYWTYTPDENEPLLPKEGDRVNFTATLYHPQGRVNPYGFDFRMFLLQKGVSAGVSGAAHLEILGHPGRGIASLLYHVRESLLARARLIFGEDSALPEALLLGERSNLPEETKRGFTDAGAAHLLAVSGLHVGLLAGLLLIPLSRWCAPRVRLMVFSAFLLFYCALLGFSAPVVRASLLMILLLYRRTVRRAPDALTALCAAFWLILLFRPLDLFSAGFQLSFCAVLGIVAFSPWLERRLEKVRPRFLRDGWATCFSATAGVVLPTIQIFHRFSLAGLIVNPFLCALFGALLPVYASALLIGCVSLPCGMWLAQFINPVTRGLIRAVQWVGALPFASVRVPYLPWYCVIAVVLALALSTRYWLGRTKANALSAAALVLLSIGVWRLTLCRDVQYIQLAMGQADAALILDGRETALIDAGEYGGDIASYLLSTGRQADRLFLTHLHSDHCMGVTQLLDENIPIGAVYLPEGAEEEQIDDQCRELMNTLREKNIPIHTLSAGDEITTSRTTLTAVWPVKGTVRPGQEANRYSLCLLCDLDGVKLLTVGDLTGDYENYAARDADILKIAHHGSKFSTSGAFLEAVSPQIALITASPVSIVLPNADTLSRLRDANAAIFNTGSCGAVTVTLRDGEAALTTYLSEKETP